MSYKSEDTFLSNLTKDNSLHIEQSHTLSEHQIEAAAASSANSILQPFLTLNDAPSQYIGGVPY